MTMGPNRFVAGNSGRGLPTALILPCLVMISLLPGTAAQDGGSFVPTIPPTPEQLKQLTERTLKNQHHNDRMIQQYRRTERDLLRASGKGLSSKNTLSIVIPTRTGEAKVELERDGKPTDPEVQEQQWRRIARILARKDDPDDPDLKRQYERAEKRRHERAQMVDAVGKAFRFRFEGRDTSSGRTLLITTFEPDPSFHSSIKYANVYKHLHGRVWVDEANAQIVRLTAELMDDVSFAGGLVAKIYRGSNVTLEQTEVEPGVWFPSHARFDLAGRVLLFPAVYQEELHDSEFRRLGLPEEALLKILQEHPAVIRE